MPKDSEEPKLDKPAVRLSAEEIIEDPMPMSDAHMSEASSPIEEPKQPETWSKFPPQIDVTRTPKKSSSKLGVVIVILLVAVTVAVSGLAYKKFRNSQADGMGGITGKTAALPTPTDAPTPAPSPTPELTSKLDVTVQVLNGSGVTGQAGKVAGTIEKLGFDTPDTANYDGDSVSTTQVNYSPKVAIALVDEIVEELKKTFTLVEAKVDATLTDVDIQVITGTDE